ncbi:MAG: Ni/Fe-hydrogenase cytochrome b subunit [SAR324 cluster bacterium]|nr:Ni/Fe-hydrogenase cytochrome b subunit [SAR324 cluster bacterium]
MDHEKPLGGKIFTTPSLLLSLLFLICVYFLAVRYIYGIGAVTNLTDTQSWGVWKVLGVLVGASFVNGGFVTALLVYIINKGQYHRFVRQAVLFSLLGYSIAASSLIYDTGRYIGLLNFFIPKYMQFNSALFEVGVCITLYIVILIIEFAPAVLEKFMPEGHASNNFAAKLHAILNKMLFLTIAFGVLLPTMHQSGLGALALLMGHKISLLWQTPWISFLYVISSIYMGLSIVVIVDILYHQKELRKREYIELIKTLLRIGAYVAVFWILFRFVEILRQGGGGLLFDFGFEGYFFWLEMILVASGILLVRKSNARSLFSGASLMLAGGLLYRLNTYIIGYESAPGVTYFPSAPEFMISVGMFAIQFLIFMTLVKLFPVVSQAVAGE